MTATARKPRASWRDQDSDSDGIPDSDDEEATATKASQLEWETITREVREERRKKHAETNFAQGKRDAVAAYDDVADDAVEPEVPRVPPREDDSDELPEASVEASAAGPNQASDAEEAVNAPPSGDRDLPPEGAITAGQQEDKSKKVRGGKKKTGSQKKRDRAEAEGDGEGKPKRRRKDGEDEDDGKWLKCKLEGDEKTKRIKASRVVYYHDFDSGGASFKDEALVSSSGAAASSSSSNPAAAVAPQPSARSTAQEAAGPSASAAAAPPAAAAGNFRSTLRFDLWDDDDSEE